ncbi:hypothetical protein OFN94_43930, partial [Escherichia coli]|nr:hypothetical protein [Escherichia coli]
VVTVSIFYKTEAVGTYNYTGMKNYAVSDGCRSQNNNVRMDDTIFTQPDIVSNPYAGMDSAPASDFGAGSN